MAVRNIKKVKTKQPASKLAAGRKAAPAAPAGRRKAALAEPGTQPVVGWSEYVSFPLWGIHAVKAKVDTGAGISALHVDSIRELGDGTVRFEVVLHRTQRHLRVTAEAPVLRRSRIKSSNGAWTERYVVIARIRLGEVERNVEVSLVARPEMVYRMLLGRGALHGILIDVRGQCLLGVPKRARALRGSP